LIGVAVYQRRVLHESGLCNDTDDGRPGQTSSAAPKRAAVAPDSLVNAACSGPETWIGPAGFGGPTRLSRKLDEALKLAVQRAAQGR